MPAQTAQPSVPHTPSTPSASPIPRTRAWLSWRPWALVGAALLLSACGAVQLAYMNSAHLSHWWLNQRLDFSSAQSDWVKSQLDDTLTWHRRHALPGWVAAFEQWAQVVPQTTTPATMCQDIDTMKSKADEIAQRVMPMWAQVARNLSPSQLKTLERRIASDNEDYVDEHLQADPKKRFAARLERAVERSERLYGRITDAQNKILSDQLRQSPYSAEDAYARRQATQQRVLALIRSQQERWGRSALISEPAPPEAVQQWRTLWRDFLYPAQHWPDLAVRNAQAQVEQSTCAMLATLHNATDAEQRQHWVKVLRGIAEDLGDEIIAPSR
ncbi:MAG: hypothetical protein RL357_1247 [Pseudomonadota bacterium]